MKYFGSRVQSLLFAGAFTFLPLAVGCATKDVANPKVDDKKVDDTAEKKATDKRPDDKKPDDKKPSDTELGKKPDDTKPTVATGYVRGAVFKHMPKECAVAKVYIDMGVFLKNEELQANWTTLFDKLVGGGKEGAALKKALDSLKKSGLDPSRDVKEIAICAPNPDDDGLVIGLGGNFRDAPNKIVDALHAMGDKKAALSEVDGMKTTKIDDVLPIGFPADSVLLIAAVKDGGAVLKAAKKENDPPSDYGAAAGIALSIKAEQRGNKETVVLAEKGGDLEMKTVVDLSAAALKEKKKTPADSKREFERKLKDMAAHFLKSPISAIASDLDTANVVLDGNKITVTFVITRAHFAESMKKAAEDPDAVGKALK